MNCIECKESRIRPVVDKNSPVKKIFWLDNKKRRLSGSSYIMAHSTMPAPDAFCHDCYRKEQALIGPGKETKPWDMQPVIVKQQIS